MSILINGMEMPKGCASCKISRRNSKKMICPFIWKCEWDIHDPMSADHRLDGCPLVPVPEHGRLIDADVLFDLILNIYKNAQGEARKAYSGVLNVIVDTDDVIPADPAKEGEG